MRLNPVQHLALVVLAALTLGAAGPYSCFLPEQTLGLPGAESRLSFNFKKSIATLPDGSVHAVWDSETSDGSVVFYRRSLDRGTTWQAPVPLSRPGFSAEHPAIAASEGKIYVGWHEIQSDGLNIVLRRSTTAGQDFEGSRSLTASGSASHVSLAADGDHVHAVFGDVGSGVAEVFVVSSKDGGEVWSAQTQISEPRHESWVPSVSAFGDHAVVAWVDYRDANEEEYVRVTRDGGETWESSVRVTADPADSWAPSVFLHGDTIFLAFFDRRVAGITDAEVENALDGAAALVGLNLPAGPPRDPDAYYLHAFEQRIVEKQEAIRRAAPNWVAAGGDPAALEARMAAFEAKLELWTQGWGIFLTRSPNLGKTWEPARLISSPGGPALRPSIAFDQNHLHVAWFDGRHDAFEIYYRLSLDAGTYFGPEQRLTTSPENSIRPSLAIDGLNVHVLWMESKQDEMTIRHRRGFVAHPAREE